jgi:mannosyl-oligosaccharide alpha-1,2-mannosidase
LPLQYQDWAWEAFDAISRHTRTSSGFTAIRDVMAPGGGQKANNQESFFFAEVLKYAYMIFVPGMCVQLPPIVLAA